MPNTREKLIELLKEVVAIQECGFGDPRPTYETVARYLIAHGVTLQDGEDNNVPTKWISVKDRLPDRDGWYLAMIKWADEATTLYFSDDYWRDIEDDICFVSHWMPMPMPPKEE